MKLEGKKINFLGDSITQGVGASDREKTCYLKVFEALSGAVCRNYGVGGTQFVVQYWGNDRVDFNYRAEKMDRDADIVVIYGGTNDFGHCVKVGKFTDRTEDTFYGAAHCLFTKVIEMFPDATIVVMNPIHRFGEQYFRQGGAILKDYKDALMEVAEYYSLPVLDLWKNSGIQPQNEILKEKYTIDGLHPNDAGHELIARMLFDFLESL